MKTNEPWPELVRDVRRRLARRPPKPLALIESEIPTGPRLSLALRAKRGLMVLGAALGFAAAGAVVVVGAHRGATQVYLARPEVPLPDGWPSFLNPLPGETDPCPEDDPQDAPPTAVLPSARRSALGFTAPRSTSTPPCGGNHDLAERSD